MRASHMACGMALSIALVSLAACAALIDINEVQFDPDASSSGASSGATSSGGASSSGESGADGATDASGDCNADLKTSPSHCGACFHDCQSGSCVDGICTIAGALPAPKDVVVRNGYVYFSLVGDTGIGSGLARCSVSGCANGTVAPQKLTPLDAGYLEPIHLAVDDTHAYGTDYYASNPGGVFRVTVDGNDFKRLPGSPLPRSSGVFVDGTDVLWATEDGDGGIHRCATPDCAGGVQVVAQGANTPTLVAVAPNGNVVFASNDGSTLFRCTSKSSRDPALLVSDSLGRATKVIVDGNTVYWSTANGKILSCALSGCANATPLVEESDYISTFAVSGNELYWASLPRDDGGVIPPQVDGRIEMCTIGQCSGAGKRVVASQQKAPEGMTVDGESVYWANSGAFGSTNGIGQVMKAPR